MSPLRRLSLRGVGGLVIGLGALLGSCPRPTPSPELRYVYYQEKAGDEQRRIVVVMTSSIAMYRQPLLSFMEQVPARYLVVDLRGRPDVHDELRRLIREFQPELGFSLGTPAAVALGRAAPTLPRVFSLAISHRAFYRRGVPVTGITMQVPDQSLFFLLRLLVPMARRVGVLHDPRINGPLVRRAKTLAPLFSLRIVSLPVERAEAAIDVLRRRLADIDALWMPADPTVLREDGFSAILALTRQRRIPVAVFSEALVRAGATMSITPSGRTIGAQAGALARNILEDRRAPETLPLRPPLGTRLVINVTAARAIGLPLTHDLLETADVLVGQ